MFKIGDFFLDELLPIVRLSRSIRLFWVFCITKCFELRKSVCAGARFGRSLYSDVMLGFTRLVALGEICGNVGIAFNRIAWPVTRKLVGRAPIRQRVGHSR